MTKLTFVEDGHLYYADGQRVSSVTQILGPFFYIIGHDSVFIIPKPGKGPFGPVRIERSYWDQAAELGTAVHLATSLYDSGELDTDDLDDQIRPYLVAWDRFKRDNQVEIIANEQRLFDERLGFAGTCDRIVKMMRAPIKSRRRTVLLDIKTGSVVDPDYVGMQTAAYQHMANDYGDRGVECRLTVQLKKDGTYLMTWMDDSQDFSDFMACLAIYRRKERYGTK
jgi:hypothetical protein